LGAIEANGAQASELHARGGGIQYGKQQDIDGIEKKENGSAYQSVELSSLDTASKTVEKSQKACNGKSYEGGVQHSRFATLCKRSHGNEGGLRVGPVVLKMGEIKFGLNADIEAFRLRVRLSFWFSNGRASRARLRTGRNWGRQLLGFLVSGRFKIHINASSTGTIVAQSPIHFFSPEWVARIQFDLLRAFLQNAAQSRGVCTWLAERAILTAREQKGATIRAETCHWSVLRCGNSSEERRDDSTLDNESVIGRLRESHKNVSYEPTPWPNAPRCRFNLPALLRTHLMGAIAGAATAC
jgi:hypothetical protein